MRSIPSGYAGLKSRTRRETASISKKDCLALNKILKGFVPLSDGWLPPLAYRAFFPAVSRDIRLEALKSHIPELVEGNSLLQTCVEVRGLIRFYDEVTLENAVTKEYNTKLISDRLYQRSKQIRLLQKTRYIVDGLNLLDETIELHYRMKPSRSLSSLVERVHVADMIDQMIVIDDILLSDYVALCPADDVSNLNTACANGVEQSSCLLVPVDFLAMILMSALQVARPNVTVGSFEYNTYAQIYTTASLRICAAQLTAQQVLLWAESSGNIIFRGVAELVVG